jgi:hypothetical protein
MRNPRGMNGFLPGMVTAAVLALAACQPPPKPVPAPDANRGVQSPSAKSTLPNDPLIEQRRYDDRGGRGGGF